MLLEGVEILADRAREKRPAVIRYALQIGRQHDMACFYIKTRLLYNGIFIIETTVDVASESTEVNEARAGRPSPRHGRCPEKTR